MFTGRHPLTGRKRWLSRQVRGQTKAAWREAWNVEAQLLEQVDRGEQRGRRTRTVGELVDRYITPKIGRANLHGVDAATLDPSTPGCARPAASAATAGSASAWTLARC